MKSKTFYLFILMVTALVTALFGSISYSKYYMEFHDQIIAEYADFCLSHDGEGKSTILTTTTLDSTYEYEGFMNISVDNTKETADGIKISKRLIEFTMRTPNAKELNDKAIYDVWGLKVADVTDASQYYDITLVDEYGHPLGAGEHFVELGILGEGNVVLFESINVNLNIKRKHGAPSLDGVEYITIVIETSKPYKNTLAFTICVANRKVMFTNNIVDYFGFNDLVVNIVTTKEYDFGTDGQSLNPLYIEITYTNASLTFDYERFRLSVEDNLTKGDEVFTDNYNYTTNKIYLYLKPGSDIDLHFYITNSSYNITAKVYFDMDEDNVGEYDYTDSAAGLIKDGSLFYVVKA